MIMHLGGKSIIVSFGHCGSSMAIC